VHDDLGGQPVVWLAGQGDVELDGRAERPGGEQRVTAGEVLDGDAPQVQRHPCGRRSPFDRLPQRVHAADADLPAPELQPVTGGDTARGQRAGDHRAGPLDREGPVDPQPHRRVGVRRGQRAQQCLQRGDDLGDAGAGGGADRHPGDLAHRGRREPLPHVGQHRRGVGEVGLGDGEQRVPHAEGVEDGDVLGGLCRPAVVGRDHDQRGGHRADPGEHVPDEPLVAGHVDDREPAARGQRRPGEAEVDGQPAAALLLPPVGLHAGQRADQRGLAVVHVAGRRDDVHARGVGHRHRPATSSTAVPSASSSDGGRLRRSSRVRSPAR
jgi:hypothetical protein